MLERVLAPVPKTGAGVPRTVSRVGATGTAGVLAGTVGIGTARTAGGCRSGDLSIWCERKMWALTTTLFSDESTTSITQKSSAWRLWETTKSFHPGPYMMRWFGFQFTLCALPSVSIKVNSVGTDGSISEHIFDKNCTEEGTMFQ